MKIELSSEQEKIGEEELKSGHFRTAEEVVARHFRLSITKRDLQLSPLKTASSAKLCARCSHLLARIAFVLMALQ